MKTISMSGSPRENVGKKESKALRNQGLVPCVIYGGEKQYHIAVSEKAFKQIVFTPETFIINMEVEGEGTFKVILQDIQYHPVSDEILHADFLLVMEGKEIKVAIPVGVTGNAKGVIAGGKLVTVTRKLKIQALEENLPESVTVDVTELAIGQSIKVSDIKIENAKILEVPSNVVVAVRTTRAAVSAAAAAAGEEPTAESAE
jgi:large subunit ribosomal protein L25